MSTSLIEQVEEQRKKIETLLHNGQEITLKDMAWLMLDANGLTATMATYLAQLMIKPKWRMTGADELAKWGTRAAIALAGYLIYMAVQHGWRIP